MEYLDMQCHRNLQFYGTFKDAISKHQLHAISKNITYNYANSFNF